MFKKILFRNLKTTQKILIFSIFAEKGVRELFFSKFNVDHDALRKVLHDTV